MTWEYEVVQFTEHGDEERKERLKKLNELGSMGWEAICSWEGYPAGICVLLKRPDSK
jgi:hypothetical protein